MLRYSTPGTRTPILKPFLACPNVLKAFERATGNRDGRAKGGEGRFLSGVRGVFKSSLRLLQHFLMLLVALNSKPQGFFEGHIPVIKGS